MREDAVPCCYRTQRLFFTSTTFKILKRFKVLPCFIVAKSNFLLLEMNNVGMTSKDIDRMNHGGKVVFINICFQIISQNDAHNE